MYVADRYSAEGMIWSSEVRIEVLSDTDSSLHDNIFNDEKHGDTLGSLTVETKDTKDASAFDTLSSIVDDDADDEGSIYCRSPSLELGLQLGYKVRGRPRSRVIQGRRQAVELSREDLREDFRSWAGSKNSEQQGMASSQTSLHEQGAISGTIEDRPCKWRLSATINKQIIEDVRNIRNKLAGNLKSSVSRSRPNRNAVFAQSEGTESGCRGTYSMGRLLSSPNRRWARYQVS